MMIRRSLQGALACMLRVEVGLYMDPCQGVSNTQKKDTILFLALHLAGKSIFTPPRFFLSAVTKLPYKEIWGEGGVQNLRNFFEKCSER